MAKKKKSEATYYVNNADFSQAVVDYVAEVKAAEAEEKPIPVVPNYVAECFMKIAENLSRKGNFVNYTFREELVLDAVENCLRAVTNFDPTTQKGKKPNAFAYFTQISWYAFLRRINKEKRQQEIRNKYIRSHGIDVYTFFSGDVSPAHTSAVANYVDTLKTRIDKLHDYDQAIKEFAKEEEKKEPKKRGPKLADSNLEGYFEDD